MDMYQKRKMRKEKKNNPEKSGVEKNSINWYIGTYSKITSNPYKTMILV